MTHPPVYDALETIRWMLEEARRELDTEVTVQEDGRARKKTKARRHDDRVRFDTLCEAIWNVTGRQETLEAFTERTLAGLS